MLNEKSLKNYKEFIQTILKKGKVEKILDYRHGPTSEGFTAYVQFQGGFKLIFQSIHYKWLGDFLGVIDKAKESYENRNMQKVSDKTTL